jgi:diguanylate cyclase
LEPGIDAELARELFQTLNGLTAAFGDNVHRHTSRVTQISDELSLEMHDPKVVLAAATKLVEANQQLQSDLASAKDEIQIQQRQIHEYMTEARTDALTGLANRRAFDEELRRRMAHRNRQGVPLSLALLDVDQFKRFNDFHGHQTGDKVLQSVARALTTTAREMDFVARYGGEEFAVIMAGTRLHEAIVAAERFRVAVEQDRLTHDGAKLGVTVSVGLAEALPEEDKARLVKRADSSLYAAKDFGRNYSFFHDGKGYQPIKLAQLVLPVENVSSDTISAE